MHLLPYAAFVADTKNGNHRIEINEAYFHDLIRSVLPLIEFDEQWYRGAYRDVDQAIEAGDLASGFDHYSRVGYFEGRLPRQIIVDEEWYITTYADVRGAIRRGKVESAQDHFMVYGFAEGRSPCKDWTL